MVAFSDGSLELCDAQRERLRRFNVSACPDIHCHCIPGLDDGPQTMDEAVALCRALAEDGITTVVATPHQMGRYDGRNSPDEIRRSVFKLRSALLSGKIFLGIVCGANVRIDERIVSLLDSNLILTVADAGRYLLLELPSDTFIDPESLFQALIARGITPIVAHPERHPYLSLRPETGAAWVEAGATFQVAASSLAGMAGPEVERAAWTWIEHGLAPLVATNAHCAVHRPPMLTAAIDALSNRMSHLTARRLCIENPLRVIRGEPLPAGRPRFRNPRGGPR